MARTRQLRGERGSLRWIQTAVNTTPEALDSQILTIVPGSGVEWLSPLRDDDFAEYRDQTALDLLGATTATRPLEEFWPLRGPQWDALGRTDNGEVIILEAKAHVRELFSPGTRAGEASRGRIELSFDEVQTFLGVKPEMAWTGALYQYCNRIAHLYFLRTVNGVPAWLINCYFLGDVEMGGPRCEREWRSALSVVKKVLGLSKHRLDPYIVEVFVDVQDLQN